MEYVWTRQFGAVRLAIISDGEGWWLVDRAFENVSEAQVRALTDVDERGRYLQGFNLMHVTLPGASVLLDVGFGEDDPSDPARPLLGVQDIRRTPGVPGGLKLLGVRPDDITHVLLTHTHGDHIAGATKWHGGRRVPAYPNARVYVMEDEWRNPPDWHQAVELIEEHKQALNAAGVVEMVRGEREIVPGVTFIPAPGESPGFAIVRIAAGGSVVYYLGELFNHVAEFLHPEWMRRYRDREKLLATRKALLPRFVAERAWLVLSHSIFPSIGRVEPAGEGYRWIPFSD